MQIDRAAFFAAVRASGVAGKPLKKKSVRLTDLQFFCLSGNITRANVVVEGIV